MMKFQSVSRLLSVKRIVRYLQLYRNMTGSCGRQQLIIWKDRRNGTRILEVSIPRNGIV